MSLIKLPNIRKFPVPEKAKSVLFTDYPEILFELNEKFAINTSAFYLNGEPWVRISCQIFNTISDYEKLRDAVLNLMKE